MNTLIKTVIAATLFAAPLSALQCNSIFQTYKPGQAYNNYTAAFPTRPEASNGACSCHTQKFFDATGYLYTNMYCNPIIPCQDATALFNSMIGKKMSVDPAYSMGATYYQIDEGQCCADKDHCNVPFTAPFNDVVGPNAVVVNNEAPKNSAVSISKSDSKSSSWMVLVKIVKSMI
jgi:hypothetical protein